MKYSKELHDKLRNRTGLHIFNHQIGLDSEDIDALLDEIERLEKELLMQKSLVFAREQDLNELHIELNQAETINVALRAEIERLTEKLHDEMSQLEIATDLGNKRWIALNEIYKNGENHNTNWCKRKAQEGLGIR